MADVYNYNLANSYSQYLKVDLSKDAANIETIIDDNLLRLEEFAGVLHMVQTHSSKEVCMSVLNKKEELNAVFDKIDRLEYLVSRVRKDVNKMEELLNNAETELGLSAEGKIRNILRPLFKKSSSIPPVPSLKGELRFPDIYRTKDFFPSELKESQK